MTTKRSSTTPSAPRAGAARDTGSLHGTKPVSLVVGLHRRVAQAQSRLSTPPASRTSSSAASPRSASRAPTSPAPPRSPPAARQSGPGFQLNRFCASGLEAVNIAAQKVRSGWEDLLLAGGVESMSRVPMGSDGGAWAMDPETAYAHELRAAGHQRRPDRDDRGLQPRRRRHRSPPSRRRAPAKAIADGAFSRSVIPVLDLQRPGRARPRRVPAAGHDTVESLAGLKPSFAGDRRHGRLRRRGAAEVPLGREDQPRPHAGQLVRHRRRRGADGDRQRAGRPATSA